MIWSWLAAGFAGTLVMTTVTRGASELGVTRMDLPFLLGTAVTENRRKAKAIGYAIHFVIGVAFALLYGLFFLAIGRSSWWIGGLLGAIHALFVGAVLVSILLPIVHPRMGTPETSAAEIALVEPPGFMLLNYGRNTVLVTLASHIAYGVIIGLIARV
ncbi:MAG TPA: hypothetical protein VL309_11225 [Vicinamibacterales bacterium]|jgi:hypothetical protein|nr:hypothetical protein [Vicinamibacterales bacterium]